MSEIVRDLVRQMLRLHFDDPTIVFHLNRPKYATPNRSWTASYEKQNRKQ